VTVEDRLRATTEAVTAAMRPVRPLDLSPIADHTRAPAKRHRARHLGRWRGQLIPLAAAMAVIAVAATLVAVRGLSSAGSGPRSTPAATSTSTAPLSNGVPRYYVALTDIGTSQGGAPVRNAFLADASTGKRLATFKPPSNAVFGGVAGSSDGKTFVLDAAAGPGLGQSGSGGLPSLKATAIWYVLRLTPGATRQARLTRIPVASSFTDDSVLGLAVSPDGRTLAVLFQGISEDSDVLSPSGPLTLRTYSIATGRVLRTWIDPTPSSSIDASSDLTWLDDGNTLAFLYRALSTHQDVRTLNTTSPGTNLIADSRTVFTVPNGHTCDSSLMMTSDGKAVICGTFGPNSGWCTSGQLALNTYSVTTGKLERVLYQYQGKCVSGSAQVVWAKSATLAIALVTISKPPAIPPQPVSNAVGVATPGKFTSLPITLTGGAYGPGDIAF
jgi:hypothetical protein